MVETEKLTKQQLIEIAEKMFDLGLWAEEISKILKQPVETVQNWIDVFETIKFKNLRERG